MNKEIQNFCERLEKINFNNHFVYIIKGTFKSDKGEKKLYYNKALDSWVTDINIKGQNFVATRFKNKPQVPKVRYTEGLLETLDLGKNPKLDKVEILKINTINGKIVEKEEIK